MPYVNIKITKEGASSEQKAILIREVTRSYCKTSQ
jgi:4-oxalocrotonate tautomerase family enzyme